MNKKFINILIGVMTIALIGLSWLQASWINSSLHLNEQQFDKNVVAALNEVANTLEMQEWEKLSNYVNNGFVSSYLNQNPGHSDSSHADGRLVHEHSPLPSNFRLKPNYSPEELINLVTATDGCNCEKCKTARALQAVAQQDYFKGLNQLPLSERINLPLLDTLIKNTLSKYEIDIPFHYAVYANEKENFILADGGFLVAEPEQIIGPGFDNLRQSKYKVPVFDQGTGEAPGELIVYFPQKKQFIWASIRNTLLASILFIAIIIFSFAYTVLTIFRQKKISEMKTDFINNMTHEFKTPIATISLATDSITNPKISGDPEKVKRFAGIIKQENRRMNEQVEKVLQIAKLDKTDFNLKITDVNLHDIIRNAASNISLQVEQKGGKITMDLKAENPHIKADATHITNIIHNLLDNANKYSPEKPDIRITTQNRGKGVEITVQDHGLGMNKEAQKHIFDKFYRIHTGNRHDVKGFGLGLAYVKAIVDAHKGRISVQSKPEKGSTFTLFLPFKH